MRDERARRPRRARHRGRARSAPASSVRGARRGLMPLAVCATPIGNLEDVTLRVLEELRAADVVLCEDTRHTRGLLERHGIEARLLSYHEHNEAARTAELLPRLAAGSGSRSCPTRACRASPTRARGSCGRRSTAEMPVTVLPGPSAVETALVASRARRPSATSSSASCRAARRRSPACGRAARRGRSRPLPSSRRSGCPRRCARWRRPTPAARSPSAAS